MIYTIVAVLVLVMDQAVKFWTTKNIVPQAIGDECVSLIPGVLHMTNVQNFGAAFSILENDQWLLIAVSVVFIIGIIILINMEVIHTKFGRWTAVLVMAGALGNAIDRVLYGYVVDMFEIELFSFAVFNVADIFITVCGLLFCIHVIFYREPEEVKASTLLRKARSAGTAGPEEPEESLEDVPAPARRKRGARPEEEDEEDEALRAPRRSGRKERQQDSYAASARQAQRREPEPESEEDWGFGDVVTENAPAPRHAPPAKEEPAPRKAQRSLADELVWDDDPFTDPAPAPRRQAPAASKPAAPKPAKAQPAAEAPKPKPAAPRSVSDDFDLGDYSLDDILNEFRDL